LRVAALLGAQEITLVPDIDCFEGSPMMKTEPAPSVTMHRHRLRTWHPTLLAIAICAAASLAGCMSPQRAQESVIDPDVTRAEIVKLLPGSVSNRTSWAVDIFAAFESLDVMPTKENICAVIAVTQQESTFQVDPVVPGLPAIARREITARAARYRIPKQVVQVALQLPSPNGKSYSERLGNATTEKALSDIFEDFIGSVPLGRKLFADWNPVRTGGPMQVSIAFAERQAAAKRYPYPVADNIRNEVFTRRGGMYFGIAHLLDYPALYDDMLFRFADFNAGHYASRNAAFQSALNSLSKTKLALDGDLLRYGSHASEPSDTELAARKLGDRIELSDAQIRKDLELEKEDAFQRTRLYKRVFELADKAKGQPLPSGVVPHIRLQSAKITRNLTTDWFAQRVDQRYQKCLARGSVSARQK
jgi:hypothetical protein